MPPETPDDAARRLRALAPKLASALPSGSTARVHAAACAALLAPGEGAAPRLVEGLVASCPGRWLHWPLPTLSLVYRALDAGSATGFLDAALAAPGATTAQRQSCLLGALGPRLVRSAAAAGPRAERAAAFSSLLAEASGLLDASARGDPGVLTYEAASALAQAAIDHADVDGGPDARAWIEALGATAPPAPSPPPAGSAARADPASPRTGDPIADALLRAMDALARAGAPGAS